MWRRVPCALWAALGALALAALAWSALGRGDAAAQTVRKHAQADAGQILQAAGFPWARLEIDDEVGRIVGDAPSLAQRAAAFTAAGTLLMPMMGSPGVFARLEDRQTSSLPGLPELPAAGDAPPVPSRPGEAGAEATKAGNAASAASAVTAASAATAAAADCQRAMARLLQAQQMRFKLASAELAPGSAPLLKRLSEQALRCPQAGIVVQGHTDAQGDAGANLALSRRRADAVVAALVKDGVPAARLKAEGLGESRLLDATDTPAAHERNRRIEFHLAPSTR
ncbi:OmpA family protein [Sphaerotilus microaerophilus]|jgi:outer membrane protein OmpA-like peptidoglycan-associated protein|uniref:OmpA-like domain-containing protein n=1 Tax=Sphaerotilus microaerophilus TaxID=2914710 RepID=A0ABN6PH23_9BURK|nr:OmpA family protein [Sphaerotilus sp. FB-5]BDI04304.1 hypothetical protein CATMQ487_12740 [Sphaerotilus sp. FB-5]